jgi:two-component system, NarL family, invasion response regulator UvrY
MTRVIVVDDHSVVREGVKRIIADTDDISVIGEAANGTDAIRLISARDCDLVLLDLSLPDMNGFEVLRLLREKKPNVPVLILSMFPEEDYALRAHKEGASGYLNKASMPDELIRAIQTAVRNKVFVSEALGEILIKEKTGHGGRMPHHALSEREFQIFQMIVAGKPIKAIARDLSIAPTTVSTYRAHVLSKMNMSSNTDLVRYALEHQLME